jgi:heat shock protein HtpX
MDNLFSTHPSMENRIAALEALEREMEGAPAANIAASSRGSGPWTARGPWG